MKVLVSWSSGKDSAWMLQELRRDRRYEVCGLLTTLNESAARVAMHAVRESLLEAQAAALGLPLWKLPLPWPCSNEDYERRMGGAVAQARAAGIEAVAFGDLYLEDIRRYREERLAATGLAPIFPLWGRATRALAEEMIAAGLKAVLSCVDPRQVPREFAGREFDARLLAELPPGADPCGENGEFHTYCHAGPMYAQPIGVRVGETVEREGFVYRDLLPA